MALKKLLADLSIISKLGTNPGIDDGLSEEQIKAKFDEAANIIKDYLNNYLILELADIDTVGDLTTAINDKLPKSGGTMTGNIEMSRKKVTGLGTPTDDADAVPKSYAVDMKQSAVTLSHSGWSNGAITVSVDGVTADTGQTAVITTAAAESVDAYLDSGVKCSGQGAGTITFICTDIPSEDLTVNVLILKKGGWAS